MREKKRGAVRSPRAASDSDVASGGRRRAARYGRAVFAAALALMLLVGAAAPVRAQAPLVVVGVSDGTLYAWQEGDARPHVLVNAHVLGLALSPDGAYVAYLPPDDDGQLSTLWLAALSADPSPRLLVDARTLAPADPSRQIGQIVWAADATTLYFNTTTGVGMATTPQNDLWRVEIATTSAERLLAEGKGGRIVRAPVGAWLALTSAGRYGRSPAHVAFYHTQSGAYARALSFDAVSSGTELPWYPALRWLPDGSGVRLAVPPPNWLYGEGEGVALWELRPDRNPQQLGTVDADFFGLPRFSPNGERILYIQRRTAPEQREMTLAVANADGSSPAEYIRGALNFDTLRWLPQGERFLYALTDEPRALWMGQIGHPPERVPAPDVLVSALTWADATTFVYLTPNADGGYTLAYATLDAPADATPITTLNGPAIFAATRP